MLATSNSLLFHSWTASPYPRAYEIRREEWTRGWRSRRDATEKSAHHVHVHARSDIGAWNGCRERCVSPRWNGIGSNPRARLGTARASRAAVAVRSVRLSREVHLGTLTGATPPPLHFAPLHSTSTRLCARSVHGSKLARSAHNDSPRSPLLPSLPRPFSGFSPLLPLITIAILKLLLLLLLRDVSRGIGEVKSELYPSVHVSSHRSKFDFEYVSVVYVV